MARPKKKYHYDEKRGRWDTSIYVENEFGKKVRIALHAKTYEELDRLVQAERDSNADDLLNKEKSNITVEEYAKRWLELNKYHLTPKTHSSYAYHVKSYIVPLLGKKKLYKLTIDDVQQFLNFLAECGGVAGDPLAKATLRSIKVTLHACLQHAKDREYVKQNPVDGVDVPRGKPPAQRVCLSPEKLRLFLEVAKNGDFVYTSAKSKFQKSPVREYLKKLAYYAISLAAHTGMRYGEVFGLKWDCVDFDTSTILVANSITESGAIYQSDTKNHQHRYLRLTASAINDLKDWKNIYDDYVESCDGQFFNEMNLVFANSTGGFMRYANFRKRYWLKLVNACPFRTKFTFHCLRHTYITMLLRAGVDLATVAARAGHLDSSVTNKIYRHEIEEINDVSVEVMEKLGF